MDFRMTANLSPSSWGQWLISVDTVVSIRIP